MTTFARPHEPIYIVSGTHSHTTRRLWKGPRSYKAIRNHLENLRNPECGWAYVRIGKMRVDDDWLKRAISFLY
jgi:hypothetical protein